MRKKRIVILMEWYLPGIKAGGPVKSVFSLLNLLKEKYDFFIVTTNKDLGSQEPYPNVEYNKWVRYNNTNVFYFSDDGLNKETLISAINSVEPDFIYLNSFWSYFFSILPLRLKKKKKITAGIILAPRGMLSPGALSIKPLKKKVYLFLSGWTGLYKKIIFHATTAEEGNQIKHFFRNAEVRIASNVNSGLPLNNRNIYKTNGELRLVYLSRISKVKNLHFALQILSELKISGNIIYDIYGAMEDQIYWSECESTIKKIPSNIKVTYKGELSYEEVQEKLGEYHFLFLPTLNENFGHSIIESLISACPVIISDQTPWNDVNKYNCGYAIALNKREEVKSAIQEALRMEEMVYKKMSENCFIFIQHKINLQQNIKAYTDLFL